MGDRVDQRSHDVTTPDDAAAAAPPEHGGRRPLGGRWPPRTALIYGIPASITLAWLIAVSAAGEWGRAASHWEAAVTMIFGSFLAGSSPEGGGAVAFPIFTKVLHTPAEVARTFSLSIQAVGMTVASAVILLARRKVELRAFAVAAPAGVAGLVAGLFLFGDPATAFWGFAIPAAYAKVTFTITLAAMSYIMFVMLRAPDTGADRAPYWTRRVVLGLALAALVGGGITSLTGTGVNVMLFLFIVVMAGLHPRVGIPTSILTMAAVSVAGFLVLVALHGDFDLGFTESGKVSSAGGHAVEPPLDAGQADLFGLWLAAVPVVVWGAPLGTWVTQHLRESALIGFVAVLALTEVVTTALLVDDLRTDAALAAYFVVGCVLAVVGVALLRRYRRRILRLPPVSGVTRRGRASRGRR